MNQISNEAREAADLLPCPFCGSKSIREQHETGYYTLYAFMQCDDCKSRTNGFKEHDKAPIAWNIRDKSALTAKDQRIAELERELSEMKDKLENYEYPTLIGVNEKLKSQLTRYEEVVKAAELLVKNFEGPHEFDCYRRLKNTLDSLNSCPSLIKPENT